MKSRLSGKTGLMFAAFLLTFVLLFGVYHFGYRIGQKRTVPQENTVRETTDTQTDYFTAYRQKRDAERERNIRILQEALQGGQLSQGEADRVADCLMRYTAYTEKERFAEQLLLAKGYAQAACLLTAEEMEIIIRCPSFSEQDAEIVQDIALRCLEREERNIRIIPI